MRISVMQDPRSDIEYKILKVCPTCAWMAPFGSGQGLKISKRRAERVWSPSSCKKCHTELYMVILPRDIWTRLLDEARTFPSFTRKCGNGYGGWTCEELLNLIMIGQNDIGYWTDKHASIVGM